MTQVIVLGGMALAVVLLAGYGLLYAIRIGKSKAEGDAAQSQLDELRKADKARNDSSLIAPDAPDDFLRPD